MPDTVESIMARVEAEYARGAASVQTDEEAYGPVEERQTVDEYLATYQKLTTRGEIHLTKRLRCWAIHRTGTRCTAFMDDHGSKHLFEWDDSECLDVYARISPGHAGVPDQPPASWAQVGQPGYAAPPSPPPPRTRLEPPRVKCSACGCTEPAHDRSGGCERHECLTFIP